uniref:Lectin, mannose-binding 2-like a n=1 Tax=Salmo trutta TaxID=8032 RepID=A0A673XJU4_SALTR
MANDDDRHDKQDLPDTFIRQTMALKTYWTFVFHLIATGRSFAEDGHYEMEEFLKREHSLSKDVFIFSEFVCYAMVTTEQVHLTSDMQSKQGAVWSRIPCHLRASELQVHFKIHSQVMKNLNGDVLAIWYTKERMQEGPVFGNQDLFTGLGVLVDTYPNEEKHLEVCYYIVVTAVSFTCSPSLSLFSVSHSFIFSHLSTEDLPLCVGDGVCTAMLRNHNHNTFIFIRYVRLTIMIDIDGHNEWRDLVSSNVIDNHDVISLKLSLYPNEEGWSNIAMFFTILFSMLGCLLLIVVGLIVYSHWNENRQTFLLRVRGREVCHHNLHYCSLRTKLH